MNKIKKIIVTGSDSQLSHCIAKISQNFPHKFYFFNSSELDITNFQNISKIFNEIKPDFCINTAAMMNVDECEKNPKKADLINKIAVGNLAEICQKNSTILIHISTDYVFDGKNSDFYDENDFPNPINFYGKSKLEGEKLALQKNQKTIIIRTSWLYSDFGKNFVKTMLELFTKKSEISIVCDQFGQPTNGYDLALTILQIIDSKAKTFGIFHFSNYSKTSWFDFASEIAKITNSKIILQKIFSKNYNFIANRPQNSALKLEKIQKIYKIKIQTWQESLKNFLLK